MKNLFKHSAIAMLMAIGYQSQAQEVDVLVVEEDKVTLWERNLPNFRPPNRLGVSNFEPNKDTLTDVYDGVEVRVGGAFALQFQALDQENSGAVPLYELGNDFNLATANLTLDVLLAEGLRMHITTYLSSQHHAEAWVKGGYLQIDKLDFISEGFMEEMMEHLRIKVGHMENNYGDAHFRRTDNAMALYNPFVGNYLMDSFTTEVGAEVYYFKSGWLGMVGFTNGKLNQSTIGEGGTSPSLLAKFGYDSGMNEIDSDFRFRLTGSVFHSAQSKNIYLYAGDRAGSRYYNVMSGMVNGVAVGDSFRAGRINPNLGNEMTAFMINPFIKIGGLEFFGIYETAQGKRSTEADERTWNQYAGELIYRFGNNENLYVGGRYNTVNGDLMGGQEVSVDRYNLGAGWFMTKNVLTKVEYVNQEYNDYPTGTIYNDGKFNGFVVEAVIAF